MDCFTTPASADPCLRMSCLGGRDRRAPSMRYRAPGYATTLVSRCSRVHRNVRFGSKADITKIGWLMCEPFK